MQTTTSGAKLAATLRRYFSVGTTSRRLRNGSDLHREMIEAVYHAATLPGYFTDATQDALRSGFGAALSYQKHVSGYRISGTLAYRINGLSPWRFAAMLGEMVDAGVENAGQGEEFFRAMGRGCRSVTAVYTAYQGDRPVARIIARGRTCMFQLPYASPWMAGRFGNTVSIPPENALLAVSEWRRDGCLVVETIGEPSDSAAPARPAEPPDSSRDTAGRLGRSAPSGPAS
jgi:hypothetical protein